MIDTSQYGHAMCSNDSFLNVSELVERKPFTKQKDKPHFWGVALLAGVTIGFCKSRDIFISFTIFEQSKPHLFNKLRSKYIRVNYSIVCQIVLRECFRQMLYFGFVPVLRVVFHFICF